MSTKLLRYCRIVTKSGYIYKFFGVRSIIYADSGRVIVTYRQKGLELTFCTNIDQIKLLSMECVYEN